MPEVRLEISPGVEKAAREDPEVAKAVAEMAGEAAVEAIRKEDTDA